MTSTPERLETIAKVEAKQGQTGQWGMAALSLSMLLSSLGTSSANVGLPVLQIAFDASFQEVQWIVLSYLLAITALIVSAGKLGDIYDRRRLLLIGLSVFSLGSVLCGLAPSLWFLIMARAIQGLGAALMMALSMAMVGETVSADRTGRAMGLLGTMSAVGTALGPSLGGFLIGWFGWRAVFLINVPIGLLALLLTLQNVPAAQKKFTGEQPRFDAVGTIILALTLIAYALSMTIEHAHSGWSNAVLLVLAFAGLSVFVLVERRVRFPLVQLKTFRNRNLNTSLMISGIVATVMMATLVVGPFYLSHALHLAPATVGLVMSAGPILSAFSGVVAGRIVDRFGAGTMVTVGLLGMVIGTLAIATLPFLAGVSGYVIAMLMLTPGYQLFQAANNTSVMKNVSALERGVVSGLLNLSRNLGLITGAAVMGALFAYGTGTVNLAEAGADAIGFGMRLTFLVAAAALAVAVFLAWVNQRSGVAE